MEQVSLAVNPRVDLCVIRPSYITEMLMQYTFGVPNCVTDICFSGLFQSRNAFLLYHNYTYARSNVSVRFVLLTDEM